MTIILGIKALPENFLGQNVQDGEVQLVLGVPVETSAFDWDNRPDDIVPIAQAISDGLLPMFYQGINLADEGVQQGLTTVLFEQYVEAVGCINSDGSVNPDAVVPDCVLGFAEMELLINPAGELEVQPVMMQWYPDTVQGFDLY
jgi:hypothetical protein